ncbi:MAG: ABC transporter ATP-binding protein [Eubacteriales bacterium]|nr:ABC transporter ATP-binding protein [Eubacteriales bacterium]
MAEEKRNAPVPGANGAEKSAPMVNFRPGGPRGARAAVQKPRNARRSLLRLLRYIGRSRYLLLLLLLFTLLVSAVELSGPFLQGRAIDAIEPVTVRADTGEVLFGQSLSGARAAGIDARVRLVVHFKSEPYLGKEGTTLGLYACLLLMLALFLLGAALSYLQGLLSARLSQRTVFLLRRDLFEKMSRLPISYTDTHRHGDLLSRMTNDAENISGAVSQSVTALFSAVLTVTGAVIMMLCLSPVLTLAAVVTLPLTLFVSARLGKFMRRYFVRQQQLLGTLNSAVEETVTAYPTVLAYNRQRPALSVFREESGELRDSSVKARVWGSVMGPVMNFLGNLQYVLIAGIGGVLMLGGGALAPSVGTIQSMLSYSKKFTRPINQIANQYSTILTALSGAERIFEILDHPDEVDEGQMHLPARVAGELSFSDIHFAYRPGEEVLRGLSLSVHAGEKVAIVGATGSGKTTVVNLLTRFYDPQSGRITLDGLDIRSVPKAELRHTVTIVLQDTVLFSDTIRKNLCYGRADATEEEMKKAAAFAGADAFIERLPEGYDTVLSAGGENLSRGQRQLLSIARAVLCDAPVLVLDEATSSVDTRTEMKIQEALAALMRGRTSLVIAHRLSTIRDADVIVVVRDGVIAESGSHEELLARGGAYAELYKNQFAGIET